MHKLLLPNQLFNLSVESLGSYHFILVEHDLFFNQYAFHKMKLAFHRASMKRYAQYLVDSGFEVTYIEAVEITSSFKALFESLNQTGVQTIELYEPVDNWIEKRVRAAAASSAIQLVFEPNPAFMTSTEALKSFFGKAKKRYFHNDFYISQRKSLDILVDTQQEPVGGQWSFDADNRKKYPKTKLPPTTNYAPFCSYYEEAFSYVEQHYSNNYGRLNKTKLYPIDHSASQIWLETFLTERFLEFGPYEDAMVQGESTLNHSVLTPMLNTGLLTPEFIINRSIQYGLEHEIPLNSLEGFVRQIIGWREFIRGFYEYHGSKIRTTNYWGFKRKIPKSFYDGSTGIPVLDDVIQRLNETGYNHHIERLMVLGNFMLLCEFDPDEVYRWFMEMYIDAYDWVMVPNVYGMSQFADGGLMATKPYISGSNYILKMSNYKKGPWQEIWDGLFWRFMHVHRDFFTSNPRLGMLVRMFDKMPEEKKAKHIQTAESYLTQLDAV